MVKEKESDKKALWNKAQFDVIYSCIKSHDFVITASAYLQDSDNLQLKLNFTIAIVPPFLNVVFKKCREELRNLYHSFSLSDEAGMKS